MKHTDEEMAEAALLLAHTDTSEELPSQIESTLLDRGRAVAEEVRYSTTKAGVVEVDAPPLAPVIPLRPASRMGAWMGWAAAAACVAFAIYSWRTQAIGGGKTQVATQPTAAAPNRLVDSAGQLAAEVTVERDGASRVKVVHLPAKPGQRYQLWLTTSDPARAVAVGSFACEPPAGCDGRDLTVTTSLSGRPTWAWLTTVSGSEARPPTDSTAIVASGGIAAGPPAP